MDNKKLSQKWQGRSEEMNADIAEWREQHPRATFREIESEIERRLNEYRAKVMADTANQSTSAELKEGAVGQNVRVVEPGWRGEGGRSASCRRGEGRR